MKIYQSWYMYLSRVAINRFHLKLFLTSTLVCTMDREDLRRDVESKFVILRLWAEWENMWPFLHQNCPNLCEGQMSQSV